MLACGDSNIPNFKFEYLHENEFLRKTVLACLSAAQMGSIYEKNWGRKSRDIPPLRRVVGVHCEHYIKQKDWLYG